MQGIVLKTIDYKEKSKIVYLYTPNGKISVKCHNLKDKGIAFTSTLNVVDFEITKGSFPTLVDYTIIRSYYDLTTNINKINCAFIMIDVIYSLEIDNNHPKIYQFFLRCLELLESNSYQYVLAVFLVKMLAVLGIKPNLKKCTICNSDDVIAFSINNGGAVCRNCIQPSQKDIELYKAIYHLYYDTTYIYNDGINYEEVLNTIYQYYLLHAHIKLKKYKVK